MPSLATSGALLSVATLVATAGLLVAERLGSQPGKWLLKPLAAAGFVAAALAWGAVDTTYGRWILAGLVLSWWGDVLLIPEGRSRAFHAGLASFLLGHVTYALAFWVRGIDVVTCAMGAAVLVWPALGVLRWLDPGVPPEMRPSVRGYVLAISLMVVLALGTVAALGRPSILVGAFMFYLSDLAVARERFVSSTFWNRAWGVPLYFGAQLVLASTVQ
jgi:uncharacterized membrane protein YhhN